MRIIAALVLSLLVAGLASGQIVFDDPKPKKADAKKPGQPSPQEKPTSDVSLERWIKALSSGLGSKDAVVRRSAAVALINVGAPALEPMKKLAAGEGLAAGEAKKVVAQLERRARRGTRDAPVGRANRNRRGAAANQERMAKALSEAGFNDEQMQVVKKVAEARRQKIGEIFRQVQDGELTREESRAASRKVNKELQAELKEKLGAEAFRKYQRVNRQVNGRRGRGTDRNTDRKKDG